MASGYSYTMPGEFKNQFSLTRGALSTSSAKKPISYHFDHQGVKVTPKELNNYLKENDGYTTRGWLKWDLVSKISEGKVALDNVGDPSFERIDTALKSGQPVIAKVFINRAVPHWVLIAGKEDAEYLIRDPLGDGENLRRLSYYGSDIFAIRILKATR